MSLTFLPRDSEKELFAVLEANFCCVFGGYIRDVLRLATPVDVDVVVEAGLFESLSAALIKLGYKETDHIPEEEEERYHFEKEGSLPIDVSIEPEHTHDKNILGPVAAPDADVNTLGWAYADGKYVLDKWTGQPGAEDIVAKLLSGSNEVRVSTECTLERRGKLLGKGFICVDDGWYE